MPDIRWITTYTCSGEAARFFTWNNYSSLSIDIFVCFSPVPIRCSPNFDMVVLAGLVSWKFRPHILTILRCGYSILLSFDLPSNGSMIDACFISLFLIRFLLVILIIFLNTIIYVISRSCVISSESLLNFILKNILSVHDKISLITLS